MNAPAGNCVATDRLRSLFVERYLNGVYEGNYQLIKAIKIDRHRINVNEPSETDVTDNITGGYLMEIDAERLEAYNFTTMKSVLAESAQRPSRFVIQCQNSKRDISDCSGRGLAQRCRGHAQRSTVYFLAGGVIVGASALSRGGTAIVNAASLPMGTDSMQAVDRGDNSNAMSVSASASVAVAP